MIKKSHLLVNGLIVFYNHMVLRHRIQRIIKRHLFGENVNLCVLLQCAVLFL